MSAFATFCFRPVYFYDSCLVDGDTALCTLVEDFDHNSGKWSYHLELGDRREERRPASCNNVSSRALYLVQASGVKSHESYGDRGSFRKVRGTEV